MVLRCFAWFVRGTSRWILSIVAEFLSRLCLSLFVTILTVSIVLLALWVYVWESIASVGQGHIWWEPVFHNVTTV